ncbi:MAG TPA: molybdopterin-dependent oxidoreductase, partial [Verrucomicrobiae bacterium]|nr:molybdopterin-dependent oxidoreductase [Verrucomicrobiae bacterium]
SPVVFFDRPRCILCYRCIRACGEGMDVWALGIQNRGSGSIIAPNHEDHLECEECGMCIDICPVGALTSGTYRYKTRPWEMKHVGTVCTHCGDGCKTTLGVRRADTGMQIVRGDNRDKNGINGDFLCVKGRYAFDFAHNPDRIGQPLIKKDGKFVTATWEQAFELIATTFQQTLTSDGPNSIGVLGSNHTSNEENYLLQKFARLVLGTNNIDHHRTADFPAFASALAGKPNATASMRDVAKAPAILLIGNDPTNQHPLLAWQIRTNVRLHRAKLYIANSSNIKLRRQSAAYAQIAPGSEGSFVQFLGGNDKAADAAASANLTKDSLIKMRDALKSEKELVIIFGSELRDGDVKALADFGLGLGAKFICLGDYANSRGASDMGLYPDMLPGYAPIGSATKFHQEWLDEIPTTPGMNLLQMMDAAKLGKLKALYVVGSNPIARYNIDPFVLSKTFVVVQDMFLTETASIADVVLPVANAYEKSGTYTNTSGDVQILKKAGDFVGVRNDFECIIRIALRMGYDVRKLVPFGGGGTRADMGQTRGAQSGEADRHAVWLADNNLELKMSPYDPTAMLDEVQRLVPGYDISRLSLLAGQDVHSQLVQITGATGVGDPKLILPANDTLFTSGTLGRYSATLNTVLERYQAPSDEENAAGYDPMVRIGG